MADQGLRALEKAWQAAPQDEAALDGFLRGLVRAGRDPFEGLADAAGDRPWAGLLRASLPIAGGRRIPVIVWNGSYFLSHIDVRADGSIDAWGRTDRAGLVRKLSDRPGRDGPPIVTEIPEGADFSAHNLGWAKVAAGEWSARREDVLTAADMAAHVLRVQPPPSTPSTSMPVFVGDRIETWTVFADGRGRIGPRGELALVDAIAARVSTRPTGEWVVLPGLGRFRVVDASWYVQPTERIREAQDEVELLAGGPGSHQRCRGAFRDYELIAEEQPVDAARVAAARERLRVAYEAVPEHLRRYVGDMDSKDWPIRNVLYPDEVDEELDA